MAGVKGHRNMPAFTVMEAVVAMGIVLAVFGTGLTIYLNVMSNATGALQVQAEQVLDAVATRVGETGQPGVKNWQEDGFEVSQQIVAYPGYAGALLLTLEARNAGGVVIAKQQKILLEAQP